MRIKRLEIKGFKSFPDRTALDFGSGVTSVVGPNGAGKSNILEALRWVMGEQRVKTLRSRRMDDVIFNGSETLKPLGLAEVRLILSNLNKTSNPAYNDYDEIMVSRKLYRDGASQYEINNIPCRLSDITDFFLDTGVGKNSYAIIEQGRVEQIVAAKPEERRVLIEEAAGINKYKARKEIALKKLESTSQNLLRLSDILSEVKSQSLALKRQAGKAERYQALLNQIRLMEVALISAKIERWRDKLMVIGTEVNDLKSELEKTEFRLMDRAAQLEKNKLYKLKAESEHQDLLNKKHSVELDLRAVRETVKRSADRLLDVKSRMENIESDILSTIQTRNRATADFDALSQTLEQTRLKLNGYKSELEQALTGHSELMETISSSRKQLNHLRDNLFRSLQDTAVARNKKESLLKRRHEVEGQIARKKTERVSLTAEMESVRQNIASAQKRTDGLRESLSRLDEIRKRLSSAKDDLESSVRASRTELHEWEKKLTAIQTKLKTLEELSDNYDSYDNPVKFLMKKKNESKGKFILEPIGEIIDIPNVYHKALAGALNYRIDMLVTKSVGDGVELAERLRTENAGRATFVPLDPRVVDTSESETFLEGATPILDLISVREGFQDVASFLFRNVFLVQDLSQARYLWEKNGLNVDLVTLDGDLISRYGEVSGGSREIVGEEIFKRRHEINQLEDHRQQILAELNQIRTKSSLEQHELSETRKRLQESSDEFNLLKMEDLKLQGQKENLMNRLSNDEKRLRILEADETRLDREVDHLRQELEQSETSIDSMTKRNESIEDEKDKLQSRINVLNQKNSDRQSRIESLKIQSAKLNERVRASERELQAAQEKIGNADEQTRRLNSEKLKGLELIDQLEADIEALNSRETQLMMSHEETAESVESVKSRVSYTGDLCSKLESEVKELNLHVRNNTRRLNELEVESARLEENIRNASEQISDRPHVDVKKLQAELGEINEERLDSLKQKLAAFGPVNLAAISESKAVDERLHFLGNQESDLKKALETLHETISSINQTTRERFMETFERVNLQFLEIFPYLFGGGQGRLELTDNENPLETGVSIMVRPPGKRYQNMDLLSGGEKALTAVALIFSIFLISPSPFCLLDEVDAPLDDANLARFNSMLRKLSDRTQFIVVTHNKKSMEESDALFGVTMEEPGASKVVSVKFLN